MAEDSIRLPAAAKAVPVVMIYPFIYLRRVITTRSRAKRAATQIGGNPHPSHQDNI